MSSAGPILLGWRRRACRAHAHFLSLCPNTLQAFAPVSTLPAHAAAKASDNAAVEELLKARGAKIQVAPEVSV